MSRYVIDADIYMVYMINTMIVFVFSLYCHGSAFCFSFQGYKQYPTVRLDVPGLEIPNSYAKPDLGKPFVGMAFVSLQ